MAKKGKTSSLGGRSGGTVPPPIPIEFSAGMKVRISHDIIVNGMIAFYKGETVYIDAVDPNYSRPEYQYVVASKYMNFQKFQLSSLDLITIEPTKPKAGLVDGAAIKGWHAVRDSTVLAALAIVVGLVTIAAIVYFVGYDFRWSARPVTSADEPGQVTFIAGIDATHALATAPGQLLKYEGSKWTPAAALSFEVTDIVAVDATHAWITGMDGKVYFYDGTTVSVQLDTRTGESFDAIQAVCALDPKHVWVAGTANVVHGMREGVVYFYNGTAWSTPALAGSPLSGFADISAGDPTHVWAAAPKSGIFMFDGSQITKQYTAPGRINRIAAADAQHAWATTNDAPNPSEVYVFKDGTWSKDADALHMIVFDISAQDASHLWVTGVKDEDLPMAQKNPGRQTLQVMWVMSGGSYRPVGFPKVKGLGKVVDALKSGSVWAVVELTPYYGTKKFF